jgi:UDP-2-acetamido-2,6-beta-L-arabino-hexul-4-ose reductase
MSQEEDLRQVVVTGAAGFIGTNLCLRLRETGRYKVVPVTRQTPAEAALAAFRSAAAIINLAGVNRPERSEDFLPGNLGPVEAIIAGLADTDRKVQILHVSSAKAVDDSPYGASKRAGEDALAAFAAASGHPVATYRLPNVFGKWCRPNYNSAVATFCHNVARGLPLQINDPAAILSLVYVDDVIDSFIAALDAAEATTGQASVTPVYQASVGELASIITGFRSDRDDNLIDTVGTGLRRALYATYVASLPKTEFAYPITAHRDPRGAFSEMLKTRTSGQFSCFTALPGVTRGGHYHHTKTEKFLIVHGKALFKFRHMVTGETHEVVTSGDEPVVVETVPGWTHDVTNVGEDVMVSLLWANELFDRARPDTIPEKV